MNTNLRLMAGRLGAYVGNNNMPSTVQGINHLDTRLTQHGGSLQQQRMIKDKLRSLQDALYNSYQGADIQLLPIEETNPVRALINPNRVKQDYDDKIVSVEFGKGFECGTVFRWIGTNTYWLIYLQDLTELAYFRGDIRKCNYEIQWEDANKQLHSTYAAIKGPVETTIDSTEAQGNSIDLPNHSLSILIPNTSDNLEHFQRYTKFYLKGNPICWRIEGTDSISTPGIIELSAVEYYSNKDLDDIENGIVDADKAEPINPNPPDEVIWGETFIKPKITYKYAVSANISGDWNIDSKYPVDWSVSEDNILTVKWTKPLAGQFKITYGLEEKLVIVESLF